MLYPSAVEGFRLVPFEAAHHGVPTLTTRRGGLDEVLPAGIPTLDGFGVPAAADLAWELLHDAVAAKELAEAVQIHGRRFTWDAVAARLLGLFDEALRRPRGRLLAIEGEGADPIGLAPRAVRPPPPGADHPSLEKIVRAVIDRPSLKQRLSPAGSRRQQVARSVITQARRQLS